MVTEKQKIRMAIWRMLEEKGVATFPKPVVGRIPNFIGALRAAKMLSRHRVYQNASVVKVGPDSPQKPVRKQCLIDGKLLIVPTPRIREGFLKIVPSSVPSNKFELASTIRGSYIFGEKLSLDNLPEIDLIVVGSVAVALDGWRLGKGEGYSEIEYAVLRMINKIDEDTPIVTTIHHLQLVNHIPHDKFDVPVDIIFTEDRVVEVSPRKPRPSGIIWSLLPPKKLKEIPILKELGSKVHQ